MPSANSFDLTGRVAIVTGGNGGLGLGMARGLAAAGAAIAIAARSEKKAQAAVAEISAGGVRCKVYPLQLSQAASCRAMVEAVIADFGRCDILVNNAGTTVRKRPELIAESEWREVLDVNLGCAVLRAVGLSAYEGRRRRQDPQYRFHVFAVRRAAGRALRRQ